VKPLFWKRPNRPAPGEARADLGNNSNDTDKSGVVIFKDGEAAPASKTSAKG
jgi:hypothetical protein